MKNQKIPKENLLLALDLESILIPELWPFLGEKFKIKELNLTTRDVKDFKKLVEIRFLALNKAKISLNQILKALDEVSFLPGAENFLNFLNEENIEYVVVSDSFDKFLKPVLKGYKIKNIFSNSLVYRNNVFIPKIKVGGRKDLVIKENYNLNDKFLIAVGDSLNDISMLEISDFQILINPSNELLDIFPKALVFSRVDEISNFILSLVSLDK